MSQVKPRATAGKWSEAVAELLPPPVVPPTASPSGPFRGEERERVRWSDLRGSLHLRLLPSIMRAVRGMTGVTQDQLAERSGLVRRTVMRIEAGLSVPDRSTYAALWQVLTDMGVRASVVNGRLSVGIDVGEVSPEIALLLATETADEDRDGEEDDAAPAFR